ncbi:MAG: hypothetical protein Q9216_001107 [Gyalolechia sp. 2 TL-2023]
MRIFSKPNTIESATTDDPWIPSNHKSGEKSTIAHEEAQSYRRAGGKVSRAGDGDTAMALFDTPDQVNEVIDSKERRRLERKIDFMILPYLAVCYAFFYIDKTTLSYAAIFGFFLMLQAACSNFRTLATLRALSGAAEACSDPSFMLITSMWYTRKQQPVRIGIWYTANGLGIAGGGILGYGIGSIKGSLPSWKYEFLIIGALCSVWGIVMFIMLPDSPVTAKLLTVKQRRMTIERLRENQTGVENKHLKGYQVKEAFMDYKLYFFFILGVVGNIPNGGISNFGTIIIKGFGFSTLVTTLMQVGHTKKVVTNAVLFLGYCTGNIAGPFFYKEDQSPTYSLGIWSMIVSHLVEVIVILTLWFLLSNENKRRDRIQSEMEGGLEGRDLDATAFSDMTDRENLKYFSIYNLIMFWS